MKVLIKESPKEIITLANELVTELAKQLPNTEVELVGALAIPMVGKNDVDIMIISNNVKQTAEDIVKLGYSRGPVMNEVSYHIKEIDGFEVGLQVMKPDHIMVFTHRRLIERLKSDENLLTEYTKFKLNYNGHDENEYKEAKGRWLVEHKLG